MLQNAESKVAFWNIANPETKKPMNYTAVPHAVFSDPQVASVGLTEEQARDSNFKFVVGRRDYAATAYGWALVDTTSFAKVIVDSETEIGSRGPYYWPTGSNFDPAINPSNEF